MTSIAVSRKDGIKARKDEKNHLKTIMVVERDIVRKLIIPRDKHRKPTTILSESQFDRIKKNSRSVSDTEGREVITEQNELDRLIQEEGKKLETLKQEVEHLKNERITEIEEEEKRRRQHILARTEQLKREEEDEIKQCNSLILSIKCKAIQDAQVVEKELIKQQLKSHEKAVDLKLEEDRKSALETMRKAREEEWAKRQQYAQSVLQQIQKNEEKRLQQLETINKEFKAMKLKNRKIDEEEKLNGEEKSTLRLRLKQQNERVNEEIKRNKEMQREKEKLESLKIQEYLRHKIEEEKELEKQRKKKKQLEERELARLWTLQKSSRSLLQVKDEIIAQRIQEQIQKKWRQKELEVVKRKLNEAEELRNIRERQISEKRKYQTIKICERKQEAEKIATENFKLKEELEQSKKRQKQIMEQHKTALREQIFEKEQRKKTKREEVLKEGEDLLARMQKRDRIIKEAMKNKLNQLKATNIPEVYMKTIEKHMKLS